MSPRSIAGPLDCAALAQLHRPTEPDQIAREARTLAAQGLKPADIAQALKLSPAAVRALLSEPVRRSNAISDSATIGTEQPTINGGDHG